MALTNHLKQPLYRQQNALPKLHHLGMAAAAQELAMALNELPAGLRVEAQDVDLVSARVINAYLRGLEGN